MRKHIFFEGAIQEGKSTLIRKLIGRHLKDVGGFSSQRLLNDLGETMGFRIVPASDAMFLTRKYSPDLTDVFLLFNDGEIKMTPEIFADTAIKYMRKGQEKKLILLDEIGGVEMLMPEFREELYEVLKGEVPCLGVLKLEVNNRHMCRNANINHACIDYHLQLRDSLVNGHEADLLRFERKYAANTENVLQDFLKQIFYK